MAATETLTLTDFLLARIAEDDKRAVLPSFMHTHGTHWSNRVLRECEAKRRIVERHYRYPPVCAGCMDEWPCPDLRDLALPYAGHPDYSPTWAPG